MLRCVCRIWFLPVLLTAAVMLSGCDRGASSSTQPTGASRTDPDRVPPPPIKPEYRFADPLPDEYPDVVAFVRQFLETCLAGDYAGYRQLVSRHCDPGSRDRFQAIFHALKSLEVTSIEPLPRADLADDVHLVIARLEFQPESEVRIRRQHNAVGILVFIEDGDWRMMPAPADLQPRAPETPTTSSAPTTSAPSYPWDEDGDS
ncbi:MAG: hypothetical protein PVJ57_10245 [Phycisphaerae bacterium]|jgi:hypothetical protein